MQRHFRAAVSLVVALSWVALTIMMGRAFRRVPSADQLADARHVRPPLPMDFYVNVAMSAGETLVLSLVLWFGWSRRYTLRAVVALVALVIWFFATVPLDLNTMEWLHRRWLAIMAFMLLLIPFTYPFLRRPAGETRG